MNTRIATLTASLLLSLGSTALLAQGALAAPAPDLSTSTIAADAVGSWLNDEHGNKIGSVRSVTDDGRTAVIMVGSYYEPGSHEARVPVGDLSIVNDKVTLRTDVVEALNADGSN